jgi:hypothetical protein
MDNKKASLMSIMTQNEAVFKGVYWYFKDSAQAKFGHPHIWYIGLFQS